MFGAQEYTRRALLERAGAAGASVALGSLLAACGGESETAPGPATGAATGEDVQVRLAKASGTIRTLMWQGYEDPKGFKLIADRIRLDAAFKATEEDVITKRGTYDVGEGISNIFPAYFAADILAPLDFALIPNMDGVIENDLLFDNRVTNTPTLSVRDGIPYGVPYVWASQGVSYVASEVPRPPESLEDLLDPVYKGRLGLGDDPVSSIIQGARLLDLGGDRPAFLTSQELDQVFAKLEEFKAQTKGVIPNPYGEYAGAYARGEIIAAFTDWAPTTVAAQDAGVDVKMAFVPDSFTWVDMLFISSDVEPSDAMYAFLNQALDEETQFIVGKDLLLNVANAEAQKRLVEQGDPWKDFADIDAILAKEPVVEWPPVESDEFVTHSEWLKRWQEFKAS